jgi:acetyltransferase-like isoleucine patch superfamily enzyme
LPRAARDLSLLATWRLRASAMNDGSVRVYRKVKLHVGQDAKLAGTGALELGCQWPAGRYYPSQLVMRDDSKVEVHGHFRLYTDCSIWVNQGATLRLGSGYINSGLRLSCFDSIEIGHSVAISENVTIRDSDNHRIDGKAKMTAPVRIGNKVWIGMNATILKGVAIGDGAIVAAGALVNKDVPPRSLVAGVPARVIRADVEWQ